MKYIILSTLMMLAIGCKGLVGDLNVTKDMTLIKKKKTIELAPGKFQAEIKRKKRYLRVGITNDADFSHTFKFPLEHEKQIPSRNGTFTLASEDTGQTVDLIGEIITDDVWSEERRGRERCEYWSREQRCYNDGQRTRCRIENVRRWGYHNVRYQLVTTTQEVAVDFVTPNSQTDILAEFYTKNRWSEKHYTYEGICR